jgi:Domain of unknown function (DUF6938)
MAEKVSRGKAWVVAVSMGYGHQRTAYPLRGLSPDGKVLNANDYEGIPAKDKEIWSDTAYLYGFISRFQRVPLIGPLAFRLFDRLQKILSFYPRRDLSRPTESLKEIFKLIGRGWGEDMVRRLRKRKLPLITSFFMTAFMAEEFHHPGDIFCVTADADVARDWAPLDPKKTRIKYCASTNRVFERLKLYGVRKENIYLTGYPLPKENIGGASMKILKEDVRSRLVNLDPTEKYISDYGPVIKKNFGKLPKSSGRPLTILFSVGGAGAQKEIGIELVKSLKDDIKNKKVKVVLSAGARRETMDYFTVELKRLGFKEPFDDGVEILWAIGLSDYFAKFNKVLRTTDVLWTKPSELSFYCALGIPIIIAPPIGSQEDFNREWLLAVGAGMDQYNPAYTHEWLFDYLKDGWFAEAAMHGFLDAEKMGTYNIEKLIAK